MPRPLLFAVLLLAALASAQERRPTFVRVTDQHGKPLADAVVTLVGGHPHLAQSLQDPDVLRVQTSKRGSAIAKLLVDRCYVAWASGPMDEKGSGMRSPVRGFFAAGALLDLQCHLSYHRQFCTVTGLDAWSQLGELRCFAMTSIPGSEEELERGEDGRFELPGYPFDAFEVRLPDGQPLWHGPVDEQIEIAPPCALRVRAVDEAGKPIASAEVLHRVGRSASWRLDGLRGVGEDRMRSLGKTDEEGLCVVRVPFFGNPLQRPRGNMLLFVRAPGRPAVAGGVWQGALYVSDHKVPRIEGDELRFECALVEPLVGSVPAAPRGTVAHLAAICKLYMQRRGFQHDARVFTAEVQPDGTFSFDDLPAELHSCRLSFVPPLDREWQPPVFAPEDSRQLPVEVQGRDRDTPFEFGTVQVSVLDALGGPARGAIAFVSAGDRRGVLLRDSLMRAPLDARGSTKLRLVPGKWVLVVVTDDAFGAREFEVDSVDVNVDLQLKALAKMVVDLRDVDGRPVAGARIRSRGTTTRGTSDPVDSILQGLQRTRHVHWSRLQTDEEGRVVIPFVPVPGVSQRLELRWDRGVSEEFQLEPGGERVVNENR